MRDRGQSSIARRLYARRRWLGHLSALLATALSIGSASATSAPPAEEQLVGLWLGLHDRITFPSGCNSGEPMRYASDGSFTGPGVSGTWHLRDGRLTETAREVHEEVGGDPAAIGKHHVSGIAWEGPDEFVKTFPDGSRMTFRRCPELPTRAAAPEEGMEAQRCIRRCLAGSKGNDDPRYHACVERVCIGNTPARARSADADARVRQQIAAACESKPGRIEPASVIERDFTGDGETDLIVHHHGIECDDGGRSIMCGAQMCSANLYVRRGARLHPAGEFGAVEWIRIEDGKIPTIHTIAHGGKPFAMRWNGREFRVVSARLPPSPARSKAAAYLVRGQIAEACEGKPGTIEESAAIERDLTGDGRADLVISHEGISCADGGRSSACGVQLCAVMIYVRRGTLLKLESEMLGARVSVRDGVLRMHAHGGKPATIRWNGREFRGPSGPDPGSESHEQSRRTTSPAPVEGARQGSLVGAWAPVTNIDDPSACAGDTGIRYAADGTYETLHQVGTWRLDGDRLTETPTEATDAADPDRVKIGEPITTRVGWQGPDRITITGADGQEMTLRRCPQPSTPDRRTADSSSGYGRIEGRLSYPSDYIPRDMVVCAEDILSKRNHCDSKRRRDGDAESYTLMVPPGKYHVYARTSDLPNVRAYYSEFVTCGLDAKCPSHEPLVVEVKPGATVTSVHPQDWYK